MAKKRKKDKAKQEEYEFRPPEFDEKEFLRKELKDTRTALFTIGYACFLGALAGAITMLNNSLVGPAFLIVIAGILSLKWVYPQFKIDVKALTKRNWAGNIGTFFFTFLAVWVLLMNTPFADYTSPEITKVIVWVEHGSNVTGMDYKELPTTGTDGWISFYGEDVNTMIHASANYTVNITARIADNSGLKSAQIAMTATNNAYVDMTPLGSNRFGYVITGDHLKNSTDRMFSIRAVDDTGKITDFRPIVAIPVAP